MSPWCLSQRWCRFRRSLTVFCLAGLLAVLVCGASRAAELVMFETGACPWCAAWHDEVGAIYHKTAEAKTAPLRRVDLAAPRPAELGSVARIVYTPTFVLMDDGREIGRIAGYPGSDHFWGLLGVLLEKLGRNSGLAEKG